MVKNRHVIIFLLLGFWIPLSYVLATPISQMFTFRVNALEAVDTEGRIGRDLAGNYYHINGDNLARMIYPELAPPIYAKQCLDCSTVSNEQLSNTNEFCMAATPAEVPRLQFEIPCKSTIPYSFAHRIVMIVMVGIFILFIAFLLKLFGRISDAHKSNGPLDHS